MTRQLKSTVVWELLDEPHRGQENRIVVEVDAPLRPFGGPPKTLRPELSSAQAASAQPASAQPASAPASARAVVPLPVSAEMDWALVDEPGRNSGKWRRLPRLGP